MPAAAASGCPHSDAAPEHYPHVALDEFVVMPNPAQGVLIDADAVDAAVGAGLKPARGEPNGTRPILAEVVPAFKTSSVRSINRLRDGAGQPVCHRGSYAHVVRGERSLARSREY